MRQLGFHRQPHLRPGDFDPWFAHKLDPILRERSWKLSGILNGIDTENYNPAPRPQHLCPLLPGDRANKAVNKQKLQERLCIEQNPDLPLVGMVTRLVSHKGLDLVKEGVDNVMEYSNAQFVVLGSGDLEYENYFKWMQEKYPGRSSCAWALCRSSPGRSTPARTSSSCPARASPAACPR